MVEAVELIFDDGMRVPWIASDEAFSILKKRGLLFSTEAPYSAWFGDVLVGFNKFADELYAILGQIAEAKKKGQEVVVQRTPIPKKKLR